VVQQVKSLEHKADVTVAQVGQRSVGQRREILPKQRHLALVAAIEPAQDVQQGRLARARATREADQLTSANQQVDATQDFSIGKALAQARHHDAGRVA
jgi:hypothetical protein